MNNPYDDRSPLAVMARTQVWLEDLRRRVTKVYRHIEKLEAKRDRIDKTIKGLRQALGESVSGE